MPGLTVPETSTPSSTRISASRRRPDQPLILGVVNGLTEWLFAYPDRLSVTISCADRLMDEPREELAETIWREVAGLTGLARRRCRAGRSSRERRATFAATPARSGATRPGPDTAIRNLVLAGDWTRTGLPATIEGVDPLGLAAAACRTLVARSAGQERPVAESRMKR